MPGGAGRPHVVIVGAGIVGASIAWHLVRAGARVTVTDASEPGGIATRNSWGWINASWGNGLPYFRLRVRAMQEWRRLEQEVSGIRVGWVGGLFWELPREQLETFQIQHAAWGYDIRRVEHAEVRRIEPHLATPPEFALHAPAEGVVEPLAAAQVLLAAARGLGATVIANTPVRSLNLCGGRVTGVETEPGRLDADEVVVAAGVGTASLLGTAGLALPMTASPALLVVTQPHPRRLLNGLVMAPELQLRQTGKGRFVAAASFDDADPGADGALAAAAVFDTMRRVIAAGASIAPDFHVIGRRPVPRDGFPAMGRVDGISGLYVAVMHSGTTLAPAIGRFAADELLTGRRDGLLEPYGTERFLGNAGVRCTA
jgi:glycine/D-amino acid oxidase-like deaminating enzyme